jgi:hypothetical protein
MTRNDLGALRTPILALAVTLLLAAGVVHYSGALRDDARSVLRQREAQLREARVRSQNAEAEKETIAHYLEAYLELVRSGFASDEQRINWLDGLRLANDQAPTFGVEYDISAQRPYTHAAQFGGAGLQLSESLMRLRLRLLHEEDLGRFLDVLARHAGGFFTVDHCVLRRVGLAEASTGTPLQQNIASECELRWLTARLPEKK